MSHDQQAHYTSLHKLLAKRWSDLTAAQEHAGVGSGDRAVHARTEKSPGCVPGNQGPGGEVESIDQFVFIGSSMRD